MKYYVASFLLVGILLAFSYELRSVKRNIVSILNTDNPPIGLDYWSMQFFLRHPNEESTSPPLHVTTNYCNQEVSLLFVNLNKI